MLKIFFPYFFGRSIVIEIIILFRQTDSCLEIASNNTCTDFSILVGRNSKKWAYPISLKIGSNRLYVSNTPYRIYLIKKSFQRSYTLFFDGYRIHARIIECADFFSYAGWLTIFSSGSFINNFSYIMSVSFKQFIKSRAGILVCRNRIIFKPCTISISEEIITGFNCFVHVLNIKSKVLFHRICCVFNLTGATL